MQRVPGSRAGEGGCLELALEVQASPVGVKSLEEVDHYRVCGCWGGECVWGKGGWRQHRGWAGMKEKVDLRNRRCFDVRGSTRRAGRALIMSDLGRLVPASAGMLWSPRHRLEKFGCVTGET